MSTPQVEGLPAPSRAQKFQALEWLRFLLALYIAVFHTFHYAQAPDWLRSIFDYGFFGTSTFFLLSGFLLAHAYLRFPGTPQVQLKVQPRDFLIKRLANLYPIHLGSLGLVLVVAGIVYAIPVGPDDASWSLFNVNLDKVDWGASGPSAYELSNVEFAANLIATVGLLHAWNPFFMTLNIPSWSISALLFFYLMFPFMAPRLHRLKRPGLALVLCNLLFILPTLWVIMQEQYGVPFAGILHRNPMIRIMEFFAGILLCSLYHQQQQKGFRLQWSHVAFMVALIIGSLWFSSWFMGLGKAISDKGFVPYLLLHNGMMMPAQLALIALCVYLPNAAVPLQAWGKKLGNCSLSVFALHIPLHMIYIRVDRILEGEPRLCLESLSACARAAGSANVMHYPVFVLILIMASLLFQRHVVEYCRSKIESHWIVRESPKTTDGVKVKCLTLFTRS